jgi:hypothetical protein
MLLVIVTHALRVFVHFAPSARAPGRLAPPFVIAALSGIRVLHRMPMIIRRAHRIFEKQLPLPRHTSLEHSRSKNFSPLKRFSYLTRYVCTRVCPALNSSSTYRAAFIAQRTNAQNLFHARPQDVHARLIQDEHVLCFYFVCLRACFYFS